MPISPRAAQQVADILTRAGVPAQMSLDVAQRLLTEDTGSSSDANSRLISSDQANNSAFRNKFKSAEQNTEPGRRGKAGRDGLGAYAWADGEDGEDGAEGQQGSDGQQGEAGRDGSLLGFLPDLKKFLDRYLNCDWFKKKYKECVQDDSDKPGKADCGGLSPAWYDPKCCRDGDGTFRGQGVCDILKQQSNEMRKLKKRLDAIEKFMPPEDCP